MVCTLQVYLAKLHTNLDKNRKLTLAKRLTMDHKKLFATCMIGKNSQYTKSYCKSIVKTQTSVRIYRKAMGRREHANHQEYVARYWATNCKGNVDENKVLTYQINKIRPCLALGKMQRNGNFHCHGGWTCYNLSGK